MENDDQPCDEPNGDIDKALLEDLLYYVSNPYVIFSAEGVFLKGHPKMTQVLWNLGLNERAARSLDHLMAAIKSIELKHYNEAAKEIMNDMIFLENEPAYSAIAQYEDYYMLVQFVTRKTGSYALFYDIPQSQLQRNTEMQMNKARQNALQNRRSYQDDLYSMAGASKE